MTYLARLLMPCPPWRVHALHGETLQSTGTTRKAVSIELGVRLMNTCFHINIFCIYFQKE